MENTSRLYDTLFQALSQAGKWKDVRHKKVLAWMVTGIILAESISLSAWVPFVCSRAQYAQSTVRRFRRWLENERIEVHDLYGPLIQKALAEWGKETLYLALDTSMLWNTYCIIRLSVVYRGRAVPLVWKVLKHGSSSVAFADYQPMLKAAQRLLPIGCRVVFMADRGFSNTDLMRYLSKKLHWQWRIRLKSRHTIHRKGHRSCQIKRIAPQKGRACFLHNVRITGKYYGPVHLAMARIAESNELWIVASSEPTDLSTFDEYGLRFDIEENFLDDKSNGFQLESSLIRSAQALHRLCFVLATGTLFLVAQGVDVVSQGKRRFIDPHWYRGHSYLKLGWNWVKHALTKGWSLLSTLYLPSDPDPEPCVASKTSFFNKPALRLEVTFHDFA